MAKFKVPSYEKWEVESKLQALDPFFHFEGDDRDEVDSDKFPFDKYEVEEMLKWDHNARQVD